MTFDSIRYEAGAEPTPETGQGLSACFVRPALEVAPRLLGGRLSLDSEEGRVTLRITEVEAYHGVGAPGPYDPGSHARKRRTERNASMFGPPAHAYVYFSYGMHFALNLVCSPEGEASGVLIRAGEIIEGEQLARERRHAKRSSSRSSMSAATVPSSRLARGPGNVAAALGITRGAHDGLSLEAAPFGLELPAFVTGGGEIHESISQGPRVGVAGEAGGPKFPWRFWVAGDPTVSAFRAGRDAPRNA